MLPLTRISAVQNNVPVTVTCSGGNNNIPGGGAQSDIYGDGDIKRAVNKGRSLQGRPVSGYPKNFNNRENSRRGDCSGQMSEVPVFAHGQTWGEGPLTTQQRAGSDRAIFETNTGKYCFTLTHRGMANNGFKACSG
jgi:hypothetical protein